MTTAAPAGSPRAEGFGQYDRRMALAFGLLVFGLVLVALLASGWYLRGVMEREQNQLATITTKVVAKAVSHVSFAGKYQAQLLLEEIQKQQAGLAYIRLLDPQAQVVASSPAQPPDSSLGDGMQAYIDPLLDGREPLRQRSLALPDGTTVREISAVYRGGYGNEVLGVLQIGIFDTARAQALHSGALYIAALLCLLLLLGVAITWRMSRHFGAPVRQLASEMAQERQRLASILDAMQAGTWEWDLASGGVVLNERWAEIAGYSLAELLPLSDQTLTRLCHPDDLVRSQAEAGAHFAGHKARYACEMRVRHKDGHWVWVFDSGSVVARDAGGRPLKMMGARQDITARKRVEEAFRQESERFMALANVSKTGVWEWDERSGALWCSPEYFSMLGRDAPKEQPTIDNAWLELLHPDDRAQAEQCFADYLAAGAVGMYQNEFRMRHGDGRWIWIWTRGSALRDAQGQYTGKIMGTQSDITSIKQAQASLRESQQQLERISNNIPDCMVFQLDCGLAGEQRRMTYISQGVERMHGLSAQAVLDDATLLYRQTVPEDRERLQAHERQCIARMTEFKEEVRSVLPDGSQRWSVVISSPRRTEDGHLLFDGIEMDVTERKQREQEIHELNTHLEHRVQERTAELRAALERLHRAQEELLQSEKLASLGALVAGVAHELNTPIGNAVTVASTLVQAHQRLRAQVENGLTRSALAEYLDDAQEGGQIVERNLQRAAELIGSFKQLAVDQTSTQRRSFALHELTQEITLAMRPSVRKTPFVLQEDIPLGLRLDSYPGPLGQVLMNLINNALLHAFEGRDSGTITVAAKAGPPGWLVLSVTDDGCGIPPEHQKKIFDPFYTTKLGQGGSGLGLHIAYNLVTGLLGGRIELRSQVQQGCQFALHLPLVAPQGTAIGP